MAPGPESRSHTDTQTTRALQLVNGGMAAGLVAMLPHLIELPGRAELVRWTVAGAACGAVGLACSIVRSRLTRKCLSEYAREPGSRRPAYTSWALRWIQSVDGEPRACTDSVIALWLSLLCFVAGAVVVGFGFLTTGTGEPASVEPTKSAVAPVDAAADKTRARVDDARVAYDSEERCGKTAREWWRDSRWQFGIIKTPFEQTHMTYTSHFNRQRNGCYAQVISEGGKTSGGQPEVLETLYDVNTNRLLGRFASVATHPPVVVECVFEDRQCQDFNEWGSAVNEYMER